MLWKQKHLDLGTEERRGAHSPERTLTGLSLSVYRSASSISTGFALYFIGYCTNVLPLCMGTFPDFCLGDFSTVMKRHHDQVNL